MNFIQDVLEAEDSLQEANVFIGMDGGRAHSDG